MKLLIAMLMISNLAYSQTSPSREKFEKIHEVLDEKIIDLENELIILSNLEEQLKDKEND